MKFDCIIMNPPYLRNFHLKILSEAIKHLKDDKSKCVNLSPAVKIFSPRLIWHDKTIATQARMQIYKHLEYAEQVKNGIELFNAGIQQFLGIQVYRKKLYQDTVRYALDFGFEKSLIKKVMTKISSNSCAMHLCDASSMHALPIPRIHGHVGRADFYNIFAMDYKKAVTADQFYHIAFASENDRHAFWNYWTIYKSKENACSSPFAKFVNMLWKVDTNIIVEFIPYVWTDDDFCKFFELTEDEKKTIEARANRFK